MWHFPCLGMVPIKVTKREVFVFRISPIIKLIFHSDLLILFYGINVGRRRGRQRKVKLVYVFAGRLVGLTF